jgi:hypothetical protein
MSYDAQGAQVPRIFQIFLVSYVLLTGQLPLALEAALFGLSGGGELAFTAAFVSAMALDMARLAPIFVLSRHPLGILHPLIVTILVWPIVGNLPNLVQQFGSFVGLFLAQPVSAPAYGALGWMPPQDIWKSIAFYNCLQLIGLLSVYCGFAFARGNVTADPATNEVTNNANLRALAVTLVGVTLMALILFIRLRGGLDHHLTELAYGRFRSLSGLGPAIAFFDLGAVALIVWVAARPNDAKTPLFLSCVILVALTQFLSNGSRSATFVVFMAVALSWSFRTRRVPWRLALLMTPMIFFLLGMLAIARSSGLSDDSAAQALASTDTAQVLTTIQEELKLREFISAPVPIVVDGMRVTDGPLLGRSYLGAVFAFVPRALWAEKPRGPGSLFAQYFFGESREGTSIPTGPVAEAYWNFYIPGVALLFLFFGFLLRKVYNLYLANPASPFVIALLVTFVTRFHVGTDDLVAFQQHLLVLGIIYMLAKVTAFHTSAGRSAGECPHTGSGGDTRSSTVTLWTHLLPERHSKRSVTPVGKNRRSSL